MQAFAALLDRLYYTSSHRAKSALIQEYLSHTPDPDRGWAIAAIAGTLSFDLFKRQMIKELMIERCDATLFELSYDYVGEMSETVAHLWPVSPDPVRLNRMPTLSEVIDRFHASTHKEKTKAYVVQLLDHMNATERWALLKLGTRGLRIGVSARFIKKILAEYGGVAVEDIETLWHGLEPPYTELLQWLDGTASKPDVSQRLTFHPLMLSHPLAEDDIASLTPEEWQVEWKYDGIRVQLVSNREGKALFSRTGDDISHSFPDILSLVDTPVILDGELLIIKDGKIGSFNDLQQRLGRKKPSQKLIKILPAGLMLYDILSLNGESLTSHTLSQRRSILERWHHDIASAPFALSPCLPFSSHTALHQLRAQADERHYGSYIEGLMLKRKDGVYMPGRPKGQWFKWKRDPMLVDAVMMYAQRGHGKRSSYYSDYTFGLWQDETLLPIGKAYSGFTDEELKKLDKWVRHHTVARYGPVREVEKALVLEVAFDSYHASKRHKSGISLRFPRIHRIRWDKPAAEADHLSALPVTTAPQI